MQSIKGIYKLLEDFSERHLSINGFGYGDISNIHTSNRLYPLLWIDMRSGEINKDSTKLYIDYYVLDLLKGDYSNYVDVLTETMNIGRDLITEFYDNYHLYNFDLDENNIRSDKYEEYTDHFLLGYRFSVTVNDWATFNTCSIPVNVFSPSNIKIYLPDESDVRDGVLFGLNYENEGTCAVPDYDDVLLGVPVDDGVGTHEYQIEIEYQFKSDYIGLIVYNGIAEDGIGEDEAFWTILKMTTNNIGEVLSSDRFELVKWTERGLL